MIATNVGVVWRQDQFLPYESVWGALHKFCRWNAVGFDEVWALFGVRSFTEAPRSTICRSQIGLRTPGWLDLAKIQTALRLTPAQTSDLFPARYIPIRELYRRKESEVRTLQYCPKCLAVGYHSALHQLGFVEICPIHNSRLVIACPACGGSIRYNVPTGDAFACACGHPLWTGHRCQPLTPEAVTSLTSYVIWADALARGYFGPQNAHDTNSFSPASTNDNGLLIGDIYARFLKRISSVIGDAGSTVPLPRFPKAHSGHVSLLAWRTFWEGAAAEGKMLERYDSVERRFLSIYAWSGPTETADIRRAAAGAILGTFVECWDKSLYASSLSQATKIAQSMTGVFIPAATPTTKGNPLAPTMLERMLKRQSADAIRELFTHHEL